MPNIPVFNINGTDYKLKDTSAQKQISAVKSALNDIGEDFYTSFDQVSVYTEASGWKLTDSGFAASDENYKLQKYQVNAGKTYKIDSYGKFQFQAQSSVPSSGTSPRIEETYEGGKYIIKAPATATWLIVATPTGSNASVNVSVSSVKKTVEDIVDAMSVLPDNYDNMISPVNAVFSGMEWNKGVLENSSTDTKNFLQLKCEKIYASGNASQIGSTLDFTEPGKAKFVGYCEASVKAIQLRHNGATQDLYVRFPVKLDRACEVVVTLDIDAIAANVVSGIKLSNVSAVVYATNKWATSISEGFHLIIPNDRIPEFSQTSNSFIIKVQIGENDVFRNIPDTGKTKTPAQVLEDIPDNATYSGGILTIQMGIKQTLFYDYANNKMIISYTGSGSLPKANCIVLVTSWYGNIFGDWVNHAAYRKTKEHDTHLNDIYQIVTLPDYYMAEVNDTANKLSKLPTTNFNYLAFTDIHYSYPSEFTSTKLKQLMETIERLGNGANIDAVLFLGDIIEGGAQADRTASDNQINAVFEGLRGINKPVLCAFGNHDNNMYDFAYSASEPYRNTDHYIVINEWKNKAVLPFGINGDYYYKDFPSKGVRVIVTNTCDYRESVDGNGNVTIVDGAELIIRRDQLDAIADMMNESQYDMVVFTHGILDSLLGLISKYNTRGTYTKANGTVIDFSKKTKKVLLYHTGHYHNNAMEYIEQYNVNFLSTSCASMATVQQTLYSTPDTSIVTSWEDDAPVAWNERVIPRIKGTANETCYDVVSIGNGKINKIGFGASADGSLTLG